MSDDQFNDDGVDSMEPMEPEVHTWDEADEGDQRYDAMVEDQLFDRHSWPGNEDTFLRNLAGGEDEMERARRRAPIKERAA